MKSGAMPERFSLVPALINLQTVPDAVIAFADRFARGPDKADQALLDILMRRAPRLKGRAAGLPVRNPGEPLAGAVICAVVDLDRVAMRVEDYYPKGKRWRVRLHEKGGKRHEMPAHHNLEAYIDAYIEAAGIRDGGKTPLFRSAAGRTGTLTGKPMHRVDAWRMIQRRAAELGTRSRIGYIPCHGHHCLS